MADREAIARAAVAVAILVIVVLAVYYYRKRRADVAGYKAGYKAGFTPVLVSPCARRGGDAGYAVSEGADAWGEDAWGRAGTVAWEPYSTQSRVSLERGAESPEVAEMAAAGGLNPVTGVGKGAAVRAMGDRHRRAEALARLSAYELQPGQPGYMEAVGDGALSLTAQVARRSPPAAGGAHGSPLGAADVDSDFLTDGFYDGAVLKEALTSRRHPLPNALTASRVGLGSVRLDPRFEPGPQARVAGGDASPAHGGHAGGVTLGALASSRFLAPPAWDWNYVHGFGDGRVEALETERSLF